MTFDFKSLDHTFFMRETLNEAMAAMRTGERPVGAVNVHNRQIEGRGLAEHQGRHNRLAHAELNALLKASTSRYNHPHDNGVIYTILEPCEMCLGAIVISDAVNRTSVYFSQDHSCRNM